MSEATKNEPPAHATNELSEAELDSVSGGYAYSYYGSESKNGATYVSIANGTIDTTLSGTTLPTGIVSTTFTFYY